MRDYQVLAAQAGAEPERSHARELAGPAAHGRPAGLHDFRRPPARAGQPSAKPQRAPTPDQVLQSFNTWSFKREQPDGLDLMRQVIAQAGSLAQPIPFILYWGKGPRERLGAPDIECLDFLVALAARVRKVYEPGANFHVIFTDTHAELNGHSPESCRNYFGVIDAAAGQRGFPSSRLGELVERHGADAVAPALDDTPSDEMLHKLAPSAAKWYRGPAREGAERYYRMNQREKRAVGAAFPRSIFATFNGSEFRLLYPDNLPVFYMYSLRRGVSVKPWFMTDAGAAGTHQE